MTTGADGSAGGTGRTDPFFDELRRLQPDVDVVLLPPDVTPAGTPALEAADQPVHEAEVARALDDLLDRCGLADALPACRRSDRWRRATGRAHRFGARATYRALEPADSIAGLRAVRDLLVESPEWDARPAPEGGARLVATHATTDLVVTAHAVPTTLVVQVDGGLVVPVTGATAREGGGRRG